MTRIPETHSPEEIAKQWVGVLWPIVRADPSLNMSHIEKFIASNICPYVWLETGPQTQEVMSKFNDYVDRFIPD